MRVFDAMSTGYADQQDWTLPKVLRDGAEQFGDKTYLYAPEENRSLSYREMERASRAVGCALLADGLERGDRLVIMTPNSTRWMLAWYGSACAGVAMVAINTSYAGEFLRHQVATSSARGAVIEAEYAERFVAIADRLPALERFYVVGSAEAVAEAVEALRASHWDAAPFDMLLTHEAGDLPPVGARDLAAVFFTSGTTGLSKGSMMPHAQMYFFAHQCTTVTRLTPADIYLSVGPLFHANASLLAGYGALIGGARFVLHTRFSASRWLDWIRDSGATVTNFVSVMMDFVWRQPPRPEDRDNDLRCIYAVPTAHGLIDGYRERFGVDVFVETCGMTEISCVIMTPYGEDRPYGSAGLGVGDYYELKIVDPETDQEVAPGVLGELVVRPKVPWITSQGYIGMPDRTVDAWRNLWFHTGDGMMRDEDGWFYYVDRLTDTIRRRGENISSLELEHALLRSPVIEDCAVVAVPSGVEAGESEVMAALVTSESAAFDAGALLEWLRDELPAFAVPRFIRVMDELPKTPSGKVRKGELRELGSSGALDLTTLP